MLSIAFKIASILRDGGVVAIPTDTQYALCVDALNERALHRVFELKGRQISHPVPFFILDISWVYRYALYTSPDVVELMECFWPGTLTIVFYPSSCLPEIVIKKWNGIGLRVPNDDMILNVLKLLDKPITGTSANLSGYPPAVSFEDIKKYFGDDVYIVEKDSPLAVSLPSTVVDVRCKPYRILRSGANAEKIKMVLDKISNGYCKTKTGFDKEILSPQR